MKLFYEKYIKLAHIGKGANAHVYKVRHAELGYVRAIKVLTEYIENKTEKSYLSFLKECKTLLAIGNGSHPNIVRIYGPDLIDNRAIVEMDYIQGVTLDSYIKEKGFLEYDEVKTFINNIVGALAYTHHDIYEFLMSPDEDDLEIDPHDGKKYLISPEKEIQLVKKYAIAHNDLHSNNIMRRDYDGAFVLLDFGLAVQDGKCVKSSRMADGSPEYQAPEKFDSESIDPRSDVYSLGILMYEALAGRVPFAIKPDADGNISHRAINTVLNQHQSATPPPILPLRKASFEEQNPGAEYQRDYPEWLDEVIMRCLEKKPENRYANAKVLLDTIETHLKNDDSDNSLVQELKERIAHLDQQNQDQIARYVESRETCREMERQNAHLLKQLEASKDVNTEIQGLKDTISKITEQYLSEKSQKEKLISQINDTPVETNPIDDRRWKLVCCVVSAIFLCCIAGIWFYKDSQLKRVARNFSNTLIYAENKGLNPTEINEMLDSLNQNNINYLSSETPSVLFEGAVTNKEEIDSLQSIIADLRKNNKPGAATTAATSEEIARLKKEINSLTQRNKELEKSLQQSQPKAIRAIETYKMSPQDQEEMKRLRAENKKLKEQVERFLKTLE